MAKLPRIPKHKLPRRGRAQQHGDLTSKLDNISKMKDVFAVADASLEGHIQNVAKFSSDWAAALEDVAKSATNAKSAMEIVTRQSLASLTDGFDLLGKSIIKMGLDSLEGGLVLVYEGIRKVYDLQLRWTKVLGEFNQKMGAAGGHMQAATKQAMQWESTVRGLTDVLGEGTKEWEEYADAFGRIFDPSALGKTGKDVERFGEAIGEWNKMGLEASRGLGIGSSAAGELQKAIFQMQGNLDQTPEQFRAMTKEAKETYTSIKVNADAAGIPVASFGKAIAENANSMVGFGKDSKETFIKSAAYALRFGVAVKTMVKFTDMTDSFKNTAEMAAKLNTVFGTNINALDMMLEQDPSKRLETIRTSLQGQGKQWGDLSRQEQKFMADTTGISEEELAGLMKTGETMESFEKKRAVAAAETKKNQDWLQKSLSKTRVILVDWTRKWDEVTTHVGKLIKPFTDALGLTKEIGTKSMSFSEVMSTAFAKLNKFIDMVASNPAFKEFVQEVASDLTGAFKEIGQLSGDKRTQDFITHLVNGLKAFYELSQRVFSGILSVSKMLVGPLGWVLDHIRGILVAWTSLKMISGGIALGKGFASGAELLQMGTGQNAKTSPGMPSFGGPASGGMSKAAGYAGKAVKGAAYGVAGGEATNLAEDAVGAMGGPKLEHSVIGTVASAVGGSIGMIWGPLGAAAGGAIGQFVGDLGTKLYKEYTTSDATKNREKAENEAALAEKQLAVQRDALGKQDENLSLQEKIMRDDALLTGKDTAKAFEKLAIAVHRTTNAMSERAKLQIDIAESGAKIGLNQDDIAVNQLKAQKAGRKDVTMEDILANPELKAQYATLTGHSADDLTKESGTGSLANGYMGKSKADVDVADFNKLRAKSIDDQLENATAKQIKDQQAFASLQLADEKTIYAIKLQTAMMETSKTTTTAGLQDYLSSHGGKVEGFTSDNVKAVTDNIQAVQTLQTPQATSSSIPNSPSDIKGGNPTLGPASNLIRHGRGGGSGSTTTLVAGDVYLDGAKVGRHVVRKLMEGQAN